MIIQLIESWRNRVMRVIFLVLEFDGWIDEGVWIIIDQGFIS